MGRSEDFAKRIAAIEPGIVLAGHQVQRFDLEFANDLLDFMDTLKIKTALLCGLSMGGYIALNAFEKFPDRFEALILSDTQCIADSPEAKEKRTKAIESIKENGVANYAGSSIINLFAPGSLTANAEAIIVVREMILNTSKQLRRHRFA